MTAVNGIRRNEAPKEGQDKEGGGGPADEAVKTRGQIEFPEQRTTGTQTYPEERWLSEMANSVQETMEAAARLPLMCENTKAAAQDCRKKLRERLDVVSCANDWSLKLDLTGRRIQRS